MRRGRFLSAVARREDGQGSIEYVGAMLLVLGVVAAVLLTSSGLGGTLEGAAKRALCLAFGAGCAEGTASVPGQRGVPNEPCELSSHQLSGDLGLDVEHVTAKNGVEFTEKHLSDGTWQVSVNNVGGIGLKAETPGASGHVSVGDHTYTSGLSAEADVGAEITTGATWTFHSKTEADKFLHRQEKKWATDKALDVAATASGPLLPVVAGSRYLYDKVTGRKGTPKPTSWTTEGKLKAHASANGGLLTTQASGDAEASAVIGVEHSEQETTVDLAVTAKAGASASALFGPSAGAAGGVSGTIAVVFDEQGRPEKMRITGGISHSVHASGLDSADSPDTESLAALAGSAYSTDGDAKSRREFTATLDLQDPKQRSAAAAYLTSIGSSLLADVPPAQAAESGAEQLRQAVIDGGTLTTVQYEDSDKTFGLGGSADVDEVVEVGGDAGGGFHDEKIRGAQYFDGKSFVPWSTCTA